MYRTDLFRNSFWYMGSYAISSFFGFFFWTIAARLYTERDVGLASTLVSSVNLLVLIASLGFGITFARFLPVEKDKKGTINPCITFSGMLILILSLVFCFLSSSFSHELSFLRTPLYMFAFPLTSLFALQNGFLDTIYVSQRVSFYTFFKNSIQSLLKVGLLFPLFFTGTFGIFSSFGVALTVSFLASFIFFMKRAIPDYSFFLSLDMGRIKSLFTFSVANYFASFLGGMATMIFPLLITSTISSEMTAYFYVPWMIGTLILYIPNSIAFNFLAEGARTSDIERTTRRALLFAVGLLIPAVLLVLFGAHYILLLFGESYALQGATLLRIMAVASFPVVINSIGASRLNLENRIVTVVLINAFCAIVTLGLGYALLLSMGLAGIGIAFALAQGMVMILFISGVIRF